MCLIRQRFQIINKQISETSDACEHGISSLALFSPLIRESFSSSSNQMKLRSTLKIRTNNFITNAERVLDDKTNSVDGDLSSTANTRKQSGNVEFTGISLAMSDCKSLTGPSQEQSRMSRVRFVARLHDVMCDTAQVLNSAFSVQNLLFSVICLLDTTVNFYCCFFVVFKLPNKRHSNMQHVYYSLYMTLCSVIKITGVVAACTSTADEVSLFLILCI
jgi:hypothetical protein